MAKRIEPIDKILNVIKEMFNTGESVWQKINIGSPITTTVRYVYPRNEMETTRVYRLPDRQRKIQRTKIKLPVGNAFRIKSILDLDAGKDYTTSSVSKVGDSMILDPKHFSSGSELFVVTTVNNIPSSFLKSLIDLRVSEVSSREDIENEKHWIVAAIRDETIFEPFYSKVTLEDVNVDVGIQVGKNYSTVLQHFDVPLLRLIKANQDILRAADMGNRNLMRVSTTRRRNILRTEVKKRKEDIYATLSNLCLAENFKDYLSIDNPNLALIDSRRSENLLTLSNLILPIPSGMNVTLFTTLDIGTPAQKGHVIFHRKVFSDDIEKILRQFYKLK